MFLNPILRLIKCFSETRTPNLEDRSIISSVFCNVNNSDSSRYLMPPNASERSLDQFHFALLKFALARTVAFNEILFLPPEFQFTKELCVPFNEYNDFSFQFFMGSESTKAVSNFRRIYLLRRYIKNVKHEKYCCK